MDFDVKIALCLFDNEEVKLRLSTVLPGNHDFLNPDIHLLGKNYDILVTEDNLSLRLSFHQGSRAPTKVPDRSFD